MILTSLFALITVHVVVIGCVGGFIAIPQGQILGSAALGFRGTHELNSGHHGHSRTVMMGIPKMFKWLVDQYPNINKVGYTWLLFYNDNHAHVCGYGHLFLSVLNGCVRCIVFCNLCMTRGSAAISSKLFTVRGCEHVVFVLGGTVVCYQSIVYLYDSSTLCFLIGRRTPIEVHAILLPIN